MTLMVFNFSRRYVCKLFSQVYLRHEDVQRFNTLLSQGLSFSFAFARVLDAVRARVTASKFS